MEENYIKQLRILVSEENQDHVLPLKNTNVGKPGAAESQVLVADRPAMTVISVAIGGDSDDGMMDTGISILMQVLESQQIWKICG